MVDCRSIPLRIGEDELNRYLEAIQHLDALTQEEERALGHRIRTGDEEAKMQLVQANLRTVVSVAKEYRGRGMSLTELINEGNAGLVRAADRFDPSRGFKFISYAIWWIRHAMLGALTHVPGEPVDTSRLDVCGWSSFRPELFLNEPGRKGRDVGEAFLGILRDFCKGNRVLELCSGSGRLLIHLARNGFEVIGLDLGSEMLGVCEKHVAEEDEEVRTRIQLVQGDMCTFDLAREFDFIILEDDGFGYLLTQEDQISCLSRVHEHLSKEGYFLLSFNTPERQLCSPSPYEYDPVRQIKTEECHWAAVDESNNERIVKEGFERVKLTYPCELELLLRLAGLEAVHRWGDLDRNAFVDPSSQEYAYLIQRAR